MSLNLESESAMFRDAFARTMVHIDGNYGLFSDGNGGIEADLKETSLLPGPGEPGFALISVEGLARAIDRVLPGAVRR